MAKQGTDGVYDSIENAVKEIIKIKDTTLPNKDWIYSYNIKYNLYKKAYCSLKEYFKELV